MSIRRFAISTLLLMVAGLFVRLLGFGYRIFLSNAIGAEGVGLYQLVTPLYSMIVLTLTSGISITGSRMIAARFEKNSKYNPNKIVISGLMLASCGGAIASILLLFFASIIANNLIGDSRTLLSVYILIPCIPIVATAAAFKGYFYGIQRVGPAAVAQVVEQITRILFVAIFAMSAMNMGLEYVCAIAVGAAALGEAANLAVLFGVYKFYNRKPKLKSKETFRKITGEMFRGTVPISANRLIISAVATVETIMLPQFLAMGGMTYPMALAEFGKIVGMAMPLIYFPSLVTSSLSTSLVAEISGKMAVGKKGIVNSRISKSIAITFMIGILFTFVFLALPKQIGDLAFQSFDIGNTLSLIAYSCTFIYLQQTLMGALNGLGQQSQVLINTMVGFGVRIACICLLVPRNGVAGYAFGIFLSGLIVCTLCIKDVAKATKLKVDFVNWLIKPLVAGLGIWYCIPQNIAFINMLMPNFSPKLVTLVIIFVSCVEYILLLLLLGMKNYLAQSAKRKYNKGKNFQIEGVDSNDNNYT